MKWLSEKQLQQTPQQLTQRSRGVKQERGRLQRPFKSRPNQEPAISTLKSWN